MAEVSHTLIMIQGLQFKCLHHCVLKLVCDYPSHTLILQEVMQHLNMDKVLPSYTYVLQLGMVKKFFILSVIFYT